MFTKLKIVCQTHEVNFVRSGAILPTYDYLRAAGINSYYWSTNSTTSYLSFKDLGVKPSTSPYQQYYGYSLRCLQE